VKRSEATLSEHGRITLPAAVRVALNVKPGDRLIFDQDEAGEIHIRAEADPALDPPGRGDLSILPKLIRSARSAMTEDGSDDSVGAYLVADDERTKSGQ
jgi:AbrB family looped-hinge helix DNA binding protein